MPGEMGEFAYAAFLVQGVVLIGLMIAIRPIQYPPR